MMDISLGRRSRFPLLAGALILSAIPPLSVLAQNVAQTGGATPQEILKNESFILPRADILRLAAAPWYKNVALSNLGPDRKYFLRLIGEGMPPVAMVGKPMINLGGFQVDPKANRGRRLTTSSPAGMELIDAATGTHKSIEVPKGATVTSPAWSPDGSQIAFIANLDNASYLYLADVATGKSSRLVTAPLLATSVTTISWSAGGQSVATVLVPDNRPPEPKAPSIVSGPKVRMTAPSTKNRTRVWADLLEWPYERDLLEYYTTGQLAVVNVKTKEVKKVGAPAMIQSVSLSPDGQYARVTALTKPFSYVVPVSNFGNVEQLWDATGRVVSQLALKKLSESDAGTAFDLGATPVTPPDTGKRNIAWMPNGNGLIYLQMDPAPKLDTSVAADTTPAPKRKDRLTLWTPPYGPNDTKVLFENGGKINSFTFSEDAKIVFITDSVGTSTHVFAVSLDSPAVHHTITRAKRGDDSTTYYTNPGSLLQRNGRAILSSDGRYAYLSGTRYFPNYLDRAPQPFVDKIEIATGTKNHVFESSLDAYETVAAMLDNDFSRVIVNKESRTTVSDAYLRAENGAMTKLTNNVDYTPEVTQAQRQYIPVTRADGYKFWVKLTLPRDYTKGTRLPAMFWFYPSEYTTQAQYDKAKRNYNKNSFPQTTVRSMEILTTQGYAVVEPDAPIVGSPGRMNDNYVSDLRNNLDAVIKTLDRLGYIDPDRLGIGGHSYGAFSTANAMIHTPFFKAGIAGDGNYNRTLTPNQFQTEQRLLWEARDMYIEMSPMLYADRMNGALLMYHGMEDSNPGTALINAERMFHALLGMGKTAALYEYAYEDHGPAALETQLDLWARWSTWLDLYVKNAGQDKKVIVP